MKILKSILITCFLLTTALFCLSACDISEYNSENEQETVYHKVNFYYDNEQESQTILVSSQTSIKLTKPEKTGYKFNGWDINGEIKQSDETITINDDVSLYATWEIITYHITYNLNGGNLQNPITEFTYESLPLTLPIPNGETNNLAFLNWTTDIDGLNVIDVITKSESNLKNFSIYASFLSFKYNSLSGGYIVTEYIGNAKNIEIPSKYKDINVTSIGNIAFSGCSSLTSITIPNSVTSIGSSAFSFCSSLTSITIPNSVTSIDQYAFWGCSSLKSITIPNGLTVIGFHTFQECRSLTNITIPNSVTIIGGDAFSLCSALTSITIPDSVTSIQSGAFRDCISLTSITIPNSVTSIGYFAFYGCSSLTSIVIPNSVTSIGEYAFMDCSSLTSVTIPNSVTSIGEYAFYGCSSLTSIIIPNSVTSIGNNAFSGCSSLTSVTIGNSVTSIGTYAFYNCINLKSIIIDSETVVNEYLDCLIEYATDVYVKSDIEIKINTFNVLFDKLENQQIDDKEYCHFKLKNN